MSFDWAALVGAIFVSGVALSAGLVIPVRYLALRLDAVDHPGGRRVHSCPTPRLGGVAIVMALLVLFAVALAAFVLTDMVAEWIERAMALAGAAAIMVTLGAVDDVRGLPARLKLGVQVAVVVGVTLFVIGIPQVDFGVWTVPQGLWIVSLAFTVFWVLTVTNAYNMIDGLDGLAGGVGAVAALALAVVAYLNGTPLTGLALVALAGALVGFLIHNRNPASIFMGDAGTLSVGLLLGVLGVLAAGGAEGWAFLPVGIALGIPLADVTLAVVRRLFRALAVVRGEDEPRERFRLEICEAPGIFDPDRGHVHHRLMSLGLSPVATVRLMHGAGLLLGAGAVWATLQPAVAPWITLGAIGAVVFLAMNYLYRELHVLQRGLLLPLFDLPVVKSRGAHAAYDFGVVTVAWCVVSLMLPHPAGAGSLAEVVGGGVLAGLLTVLLLRMGRVYRGSFRHVGVWQASRMAVLTVGVVLATGVVLQVFLSTTTHTAAFVVLLALLTAVPLVGARISFRVLDAFYQRRARDGRKVLIYGAGRCGVMALTAILQREDSHRVPVGFIDDAAELQGRSVNGYPILGGVAALGEILDSTGALEVIVATERLASENRHQLENTCASRAVAVRRWNANLDEEYQVPAFHLAPPSAPAEVTWPS